MVLDWNNLNVWLYGIAMALLGGIVYLIRRVFTNQAEMKLLQQRLELYEHYRKEQTAEITNQLIEIRTDIKALMRKDYAG